MHSLAFEARARIFCIHHICSYSLKMLKKHLITNRYSASMQRTRLHGQKKIGVSENSVPLNPMVLLIIIPIKNGYFIGGIPHFQTNPNRYAWYIMYYQINNLRYYDYH